MIPKMVPEALQRFDTNGVYWFAIMPIAFRYGWHGTGSFVLISSPHAIAFDREP